MATNVLSFPLQTERLTCGRPCSDGDLSEPHPGVRQAFIHQIRRTHMTPLITLYLALPAIFTVAVTVRNVIFGDVV